MSENISPNIIPKHRYHYVTCLMCRTDYCEKLDINDDEYRSETGYCPGCVLICRNCEKKKIDISSDKGLCKDCEKLWRRELEGINDPDNDDNDDESTGKRGNDDNDGNDEDQYQNDSEDEKEEDENDFKALIKHLVTEMVITVAERFEEAEITHPEQQLTHDASTTLVDIDSTLEELNKTFEEALTDTEDELLSVHAISVADPEDGLVIKTKRTHGTEISRQLLSEYQKSHGRVGSDGSGGSTNGELAAAGCKKICSALEINKEDYLCDIGSGGGLALMQMTAEASNKCSIGIEFEQMRHIIATNFNKRLMEKRPEKNCPVAYLNADISSFANLNGITKVYMYDAVFEPGLLLTIGQIFNATKTIQYIASTQNLPEFGFNVELYKHLGSLSGRGGNMSHTFSVYKSKHFELSSASLPMDKRLVELFSVAMNKDARYHLSKSFIDKFHGTKMVPRSAPPSVASGVNYVKQATPLSTLAKADKAEELFYLLKKNKPLFTFNGITYKLGTRTNAYERYDEKQLKCSKIECSAVAKPYAKKALIVPSYSGDVKGEGKILVSIMYDTAKSNGLYVGVVYDLHDKVFRDKVPISELYYMFDYTSVIPETCNMEDIMKKYRKMYPLDPTRTTDVPDKRVVNVITPAKEESLEDGANLRYRPPSRSKSRKRTADTIMQNEEDSNQDNEAMEVEPEKQKPSKVKRTTPIEDKLRSNLQKQREIIADLKRKLDESNEQIRNLEVKPRKQQKEDTKTIIDEAIQKAASKYLSSTTQVEGKLSNLSLKNAELSAQVKVYQESFEHIKAQHDRLDSIQKVHALREQELLKEQKEAEKKAAESDTKYQVASKEAEMYKLQQKREDERQDKEQKAREKATTDLYALLGKFAPNK